MIPYHNRIRDGRLTFGAQTFRIEPHPEAAPNSLHGPAHRDAWMVTLHNQTQIGMTLSRDADRHWPWAFEARQAFSVSSSGLKLMLAVVNRSTRPMPAGLGWHPYFAGCRLVRHDAEYSWPIGASYLPQGYRVAAGHNDPAIVTGTEYLSCWSDLTMLTASGLALTLSASPVLSNLVLHKGDGDYLCAEPASHVADGFNLDATGVLGTGARVLGPQEELSATIVLAITRNQEF